MRGFRCARIDGRWAPLNGAWQVGGLRCARIGRRWARLNGGGARIGARIGARLNGAPRGGDNKYCFLLQKSGGGRFPVDS